MPSLKVFTLYKMPYKEDMINPKRILSRYQVRPAFQRDQRKQLFLVLPGMTFMFQ